MADQRFGGRRPPAAGSRTRPDRPGYDPLASAPRSPRAERERAQPRQLRRVTLDQVREFSVEAGAVVGADVRGKGRFVPVNLEHEIAVRIRLFGIRIEDDVLITNEGYEVLTNRLPRQLS